MQYKFMKNKKIDLLVHPRFMSTLPDTNHSCKHIKHGNCEILRNQGRINKREKVWLLTSVTAYFI